MIHRSPLSTTLLTVTFTPFTNFNDVVLPPGRTKPTASGNSTRRAAAVALTVFAATALSAIKKSLELEVMYNPNLTAVFVPVMVEYTLKIRLPTPAAAVVDNAVEIVVEPALTVVVHSTKGCAVYCAVVAMNITSY
jgi:hypothetical protein